MLLGALRSFLHRTTLVCNPAGCDLRAGGAPVQTAGAIL
jgi:hypothetical protein